MIFQILILFIVFICLIERLKNRKIYELSRKLKNDVPIMPVLGHLYLFKGSGEDRMTVLNSFGRKALNNGGLAALWLGPRLFTVVADPETTDFLMKNCLEKDDITNKGQCLIGHGSIFAPVSIWRRRRRIVSPTFSMLRLNNFVDIFSGQSQIMVDKLKLVKETEPVSLWKYLATYSMDAVCESTLGIKVDAQGNTDHPFPKAFEIHCKMDVKKIFEPYIYEMPFYKLTEGYATFTKSNTYLRDFVRQLIRSKRQQHENDTCEENLEDKQSRSFLEMMIKTPGDEPKLSDVELLEESLVLILAGTDTSATGAGFIALMLARHPEVQEKVYQELRDVLGDLSRPITSKDLSQLKYLDAVVRETVRLYPPVPAIIRKIEEDVTLPSGLVLLKDTSFLISIWAANRNPQYWGDDAEEFRPERFIDTPIKHPAAFLTFSVGPRNCLGYKYAMMSMKTVVGNMTRNFQLLPADPSDANSYVDCGKCLEKEKPLRVKFEIMMRDVENFKVQLKPRETIMETK